jgi:hypothetical protein
MTQTGHPLGALWSRAANNSARACFTTRRPQTLNLIGWRHVDHTHIVFDGDRRAEWLGQILDKLEGDEDRRARTYLT